MSQSTWFAVLEQWKARDMGQYGVTLPFLVGALGKSASEISRLLHEIAHSPVPGYVTEVRWCAQLDAPTFSVSKIDKSKMHFESFIPGPSGEPSLGFSKDLQSSFGLNCKSSDECLKKLANDAATHVKKHQFSRIRNTNTNTCEYTSFTQAEIQFIKEVVGRDPREI